jgi:PAS domain S-box-containing protein
MNPGLFAPLCAVLISVASLSWILAQEIPPRLRRASALRIAAAVWLATADLLCQASPGADTALFWLRASAPALIAHGPLIVNLGLVVSSNGSRSLPRGWVHASIATALVLSIIAVTTPWIVGSVAPGPFGWRVVAGPLFGPALVVLFAHVVPAAAIGLRGVRKAPAVSAHPAAPWITAVSLSMMGVVIFSELVLPALGVPFPRLGSLALSIFCACVAWSSRHLGYLPLRQGGTARRILDSHPDGVALVLQDGRIGTASQGLAQLAGVSADAIVGRPLGSLLEPDLGRPLRNVADLDAQLRCADGVSIPVSVSARVLERGVDGRPAWVVAVRDVREVVALKSRLITSGRLAAMGQLAAGIAHEINNPMAFVRANLVQLSEGWDALAKPSESPQEHARRIAEAKEMLDECLEGVERTCAIVRDIRGFAHQGGADPEPVALEPLLDNVVRVASPQIGAGVGVHRDLAAVPAVAGFEQELKQLFLNLVVNAAHAVGERGTIRVRTARDGARVRVEISDDGPGIPSEAMARIFDPFFTTKPVGVGTGLGLFVSHEIVRRHGGSITVDSDPATGTRVAVVLPTAELDSPA